jgi:hypothetical protein
MNNIAVFMIGTGIIIAVVSINCYRLRAVKKMLRKRKGIEE